MSISGTPRRAARAKRVLATAALAAQLLLPATASLPQENGSSGPTKPRRVWTNEDLDELQGTVNVVGKATPPRGKATAGSAAFGAARAVLPGPVFRAQTITGEPITASVVNGNPVLVQFWTTWCPVCRGDQPAVDKITQEYADRLLVLAVDVGETRKVVEGYLSKSPRSCRVVMAEDTNLTGLRRATGYPHYVLLDRNGQVVATHTGRAPMTVLREMLHSVEL
jgi:thiol-disulfide isomerase/thioredoxin